LLTLRIRYSLLNTCFHYIQVVTVKVWLGSITFLLFTNKYRQLSENQCYKSGYNHLLNNISMSLLKTITMKRQKYYLTLFLAKFYVIFFLNRLTFLFLWNASLLSMDCQGLFGCCCFFVYNSDTLSPHNMTGLSNIHINMFLCVRK
jgi:hypothetical protein